MLTVRKRTGPGSQDLMRPHPRAKVHGLNYSHPSYDLVYVPDHAVIDRAIPGKNSRGNDARPRASDHHSNDGSGSTAESISTPTDGGSEASGSKPNPIDEHNLASDPRTDSGENSATARTPRMKSSDEEAAIPLKREGFQLSKSKNITKSLIAVLQLCFSLFVLIKSKANQIDLYGYAAFSLTVAPYAVMATVNLLANVFQPTYSSLYLVRNDVMDEIEGAFGMHFDNTVGTVLQVEPPTAYPNGVPAVLNPLLLADERREQDQHRRVYGIPGISSDAAPELMTPDQAVARGLLPQRVITVHPCKRVKIGKGSDAVLASMM